MNLITSRPPTEEIITLDVPSGATYNLVILPEDNVGNMASLSNGGESLEVYFPVTEGTHILNASGSSLVKVSSCILCNLHFQNKHKSITDE